MLEGPRSLRTTEFDALMDLVDDTFRGPDWPHPTHPKLYSLLLNPNTNLDGMRVFAQDGRPVAHFGFYTREAFCGGSQLRVASVGSVCTHPDFRGRGLATRLVIDALEMCAAQDVHVMLISGGRGLYRRQGATDVGEMRYYTLTADDLPPKRNVRLEAWSDAMLPACAAIYQCEPFRFRRSLDDWKRVVRSGTDMNRGAETFLVYYAGALRAYASVYAPEGGGSGFLEYGGSRQALFAAIPCLFERYDLSEFEIAVPSFDLEWQTVCEGVSARRAPIKDHTARLVNLAALGSALRDYAEERLGGEAGQIEWCDQLPYRIRSPEGSLKIERMDTLTRLVLGPHTAEVRDALASASGLGEQLRWLFPIPFGFPGLNFV